MWIIIFPIFLIFLLLGYSIIPTNLYKLKHHINSLSTLERKIYLTFDDGPDTKYTKELLDLLKNYNIKASFFVVAKFAEENKEIIERMKSEGHVIGLHSLEHRNALWQTPNYTKTDFDESIKIMKSLNIDVKYFRPPWGHSNISTRSCMKKHGLKMILWNVMAEDWSGNTTANIIVKKLLRRTKNGDIICLHDGRGKNEAPSRTITALERVLPIWIYVGYQFATVEELYE